MMNGKVNRIVVKDNREQSFVFIKGDDGNEYFLHRSDLFDNWDEFRELIKSIGEVEVSYEFTEGEKGRRAVGAKIVHHKGNRK